MFEPPLPLAGHKRKRGSSHSHPLQPTPQPKHPYLSGNFAPIQQTLPLTPCTHTGTIPAELADGQYVRNGSNPVSNEDLGRDAHWFDGDGMLAGVLFRRDEATGKIEPEFVNQYILTDLYLSTLSSPRLRVPILPSIATLVNPLYSLFHVTLRILRTVVLVVLSFLPGSKQKIKKISVANTNIVYHDGRALATCESGPPMRIQLPELETVGWYNGAWAEGELNDKAGKMDEEMKELYGKKLGEDSMAMLGWMREWTTAHPKIDPVTEEMLMFHSSFAPPFVQYSIIPQQQQQHASNSQAPAVDDGNTIPPRLDKLLNAPVPGITKAKMMHDFGVSLAHTVIMDLPLSLDPMNQLRGLPPVSYDSSRPSRFGVFPRRQPEKVRWFETDASCIFHTANTWDTPLIDEAGEKTTEVNMLACRLTSATMVYAAGNIAAPVERKPKVVLAETKKRRMPFFSKYDDAESTAYERAALLESPSEEKEAFVHINEGPSPSPFTSSPDDEEEEDRSWEEDQCRLYYYAFALSSPPSTNQITHQWALTTIPFEFPSVRPDKEMQSARFIYGCSTSTTSFGSALGKATKIDVLVKIDALTLIDRGRRNPPRSVGGSVDTRTMAEILAGGEAAGDGSIQAFQMPEGWFAQEPRFVPASSNEGEDDGWLLFYAFDEAQLLPSGDVPAENGDGAQGEEGRARSELWVLSARDMKTVVARVELPQRVPYGLHGSWFDGGMIKGQRGVEGLRRVVEQCEGHESGGVWMGVRGWVEGLLG
ncbi:hypothetical protein B0A55_11614 [Friedmanniomyces simplex]|uniref:Carotenoid oxygenase n=1 Tax=Friedmanniomyces simplex TaxID=329884 RepID=A0A4V5NDC1_9PEZI|nr:hypothetical protein B0A55_11614 [Friedmanniomyces simplex]